MRGERRHGRSIGIAQLGALLTAVLGGSLPAQHEHPPHPPARPAAEVKNGAPMRPTHAPQPQLPPLVAWQHVRSGNEALATALAARQPAPAPKDRPAGAGRYVCAVIVCADAEVDVPTLLGLRRSDVLLLSAPGPFVQPEAIALLEQAVAEERLSLVLVIGHPDCRTRATLRGVSPAQDAIVDRLDAVRSEAVRMQTTWVQTLVRMQCAQLVAASDLLRQHVTSDDLRVLPAELDPRSATLTWQHARGEEFALRPVR